MQAYDADLDDLAVDGSIDGSKVVPAFGSQNITTAGYATLTNGLRVGSASVPTTGNLEVYDDFSDLVNPVDDARAIEKLMKEKYGFKTEFVEDPLYEDIYAKISEYTSSASTYFL